MSTLNITHNKKQTKSGVVARLATILIILSLATMLIPTQASAADDGDVFSIYEVLQPNPCGTYKWSISDIDGNIIVSSSGEGPGEIDIENLARGYIIDVQYPPTTALGWADIGGFSVWLDKPGSNNYPYFGEMIRDENGVFYGDQPDFFQERPPVETETRYMTGRFKIMQKPGKGMESAYIVALPNAEVTYTTRITQINKNIHGLQAGRQYNFNFRHIVDGAMNYDLMHHVLVGVTDGDGTGAGENGSGETDGEPGDLGPGTGTTGEDAGDGSGNESSESTTNPGDKTQTGSNTGGEEPASGNVDKTTVTDANGSITTEATNGSMESLPSASAKQLSQVTANDDDGSSGVAGQTQAIPLAGGGRLYTVKGGIVESLPEFAEQLITSTQDMELISIAWLRIALMATLVVSLPVGFLSRRLQFRHSVKKMI